MANKWIGCTISVTCGDVLGEYKGYVIQVDSENQTLTLTNVERNGTPCSLPKITLRAEDITRISIVNTMNDKPISESKAKINITNATAIQEKPQGESRKKSSTPKKGERTRRFTDRDDACFSEPVNEFILDNEFDFEKNLALFDKHAVFEELNALAKPDVVRLADCNRRSQQTKYKNDENILVQEPVIFRQIDVPCIVEKEFFTDSGLIVPSITRELRHYILSNAEKVGFSVERRTEMIGRSAAEMILQLIGGSHRLNPQNLHQRPTAVVLCGHHIQGAQGINCARQLSNHGVNVCLMTAMTVSRDPTFNKELGLYKYTGCKTAQTIGDLPSNVDIIVGALDSVDEEHHQTETMWQKVVMHWVSQCRAPVLCLDPPPGGDTSLNPKWILTPLLPFAFGEVGVSVYICDLGIPNEVFSSAGVKYVSMFGSKFVIPLYHRNNRRQ